MNDDLKSNNFYSRIFITVSKYIRISDNDVMLITVLNSNTHTSLFPNLKAVLIFFLTESATAFVKTRLFLSTKHWFKMLLCYYLPICPLRIQNNN